MKIEAGKVYKNWHYLFEELGMNPKAKGNPKNAQIKEIERYCTYHKDGNKIIIDEVFDEAKEKVDGRINNGKNPNSHKNTNYDDVCAVVNTFLAKKLNAKGNKKLNTTDYLFTKEQLLLNFGLVNGNFAVTKGNEKTKKFNIETTNSAWQTIKSSLEKMRENGLIKYNDKAITFIDGDGKRKIAFDGDSDYSKYAKVVNDTVKAYKYKNLYSTIISNDREEIFCAINDDLKEEYGWTSVKKMIYIAQVDGKEYTDEDVTENKLKLNEKFVAKLYKKANKITFIAHKEKDIKGITFTSEVRHGLATNNVIAEDSRKAVIKLIDNFVKITGNTVTPNDDKCQYTQKDYEIGLKRSEIAKRRIQNSTLDTEDTVEYENEWERYGITQEEYEAGERALEEYYAAEYFIFN